MSTSSKLLEEAKRILLNSDQRRQERHPLDRATVEANFIGYMTEDIQLGILIRAIGGDSFPLAKAIQQQRKVLSVIGNQTMDRALWAGRGQREDAPAIPKARKVKKTPSRETDVHLWDEMDGMPKDALK